jgi:hypothetical protein
MPHRLTLHNGIPEHSRWCDCLDCRVAWEEYQEAEYALRLLAAQDEQIRQAKPATDQEWAEFDAEFPRAKEGVA